MSRLGFHLKADAATRFVREIVMGHAAGSFRRRLAVCAIYVRLPSEFVQH